MTYRLAILEDNATARANLRSHLLRIDQFEVSSFSQGNELLSALRIQHFEIIIFDYVLGQGKTGVEWLSKLRQAQFIKPSTGIIFITSDRQPQTIGQIIDAQPDLLLIKPYNMQTLSRGINHYIEYRQLAGNVLNALDNNEPLRALKLLEASSRQAIPARLRNDVAKLRAQLLFEAGQIKQARALYESILADSNRVLWAQWGKIKCLYIEGNWTHCQDDLSALEESALARDKAFEWLASLSFEKQAYSQAEYYLDHIKISALSVPATRLKSLTYQRQDRVIEGIELLEKKREANRTARETFSDFTIELAEFYLAIAEHQTAANRTESLSQARRLTGIASRYSNDAQSAQKQTVLTAYCAILDEDINRARALMQEQEVSYFSRADVSALIIAAKVYFALQQPQKARELLAVVHSRTRNNLSLAQRTLHQDSLLVAQQQLGIAAEQAFELNDKGTDAFLQKDYLKAAYYFYQAYRLLPETAAFGLNLLHCMTEADLSTYRTVSLAPLLALLEKASLSAANQARLSKLRNAIEKRSAQS